MIFVQYESSFQNRCVDLNQKKLSCCYFKHNIVVKDIKELNEPKMFHVHHIERSTLAPYIVMTFHSYWYSSFLVLTILQSITVYLKKATVSASVSGTTLRDHCRKFLKYLKTSIVRKYDNVLIFYDITVWKYCFEFRCPHVQLKTNRKQNINIYKIKM